MTLSRVLILVFIVLFFHSEQVVPFRALRIHRWNTVPTKKLTESNRNKISFPRVKAADSTGEVQDEVWTRIRNDAAEGTVIVCFWVM
jgi:hypothetical protein